MGQECCRVYLVGTPEQVDRGKRILVALVEDQAGRGEDVVEIPQSSVGRALPACLLSPCGALKAS